MATLSFSCPQCSKTLKIDESAAGKTARCPACTHRFAIPKPKTDQQAPLPVAIASPLQQAVVPVAPVHGTKKCRFCGETIDLAAVKCKHCGEWLQESRGVSPQRSEQGIKVVAPASAAVFTIITLGIYQIFWLYRVVTELHSRGSMKTPPGKAVGFLFIPFFNFVWIFVIWKEIGDAIAREHARARLPIPATGLVWLAPVAVLLGLAELVAPYCGRPATDPAADRHRQRTGMDEWARERSERSASDRG